MFISVLECPVCLRDLLVFLMITLNSCAGWRIPFLSSLRTNWKKKYWMLKNCQDFLLLSEISTALPSVLGHLPFSISTSRVMGSCLTSHYGLVFQKLCTFLPYFFSSLSLSHTQIRSYHYFLGELLNKNLFRCFQHNHPAPLRAKPFGEVKFWKVHVE